MKINLFSAWTAIMAAAGCSGSSTTGDAGADAATDMHADGPLAEAASAGACNALVNIAQSIPITQVASGPPVLQGGVPVRRRGVRPGRDPTRDRATS